MGIELAADTVSGIFARFLNSWLLSLRVPYEVLFGVNLALMLAGLLSCAFAKVSLECIGIFLIGFSSSLGETIMLCYMSYRRKEVLLKSWSSGTGFAGIAGAGYSLICVWAKVSNFWSLIAVSPVVILYGLVFYLVLVRSPEEQPPGGLSASLLSDGAVSVSSMGEEKVGLFDCSYFRENSFLIFNCGAVYFREYTIQTLFAHSALSGAEMTKWRFAFPLLNLCYQGGVFLSRSHSVSSHFQRYGC
jgi:battenin